MLANENYKTTYIDYYRLQLVDSSNRLKESLKQMMHLLCISNYRLKSCEYNHACLEQRQNRCKTEARVG